MQLAITYALFALVATIVNIVAQDVVTRLHDGRFALVLSMVVGTLAGLVVKYVLDKRYIFRFQARDLIHDSQTLALYTLMGLATTAIFWAFELGFAYLLESREMRYLGGAIGLAIGYVTKYHLDKRYVFQTTRPEQHIEQ
jgi:putative flippase GtrA